jgi:ATP-binding cassette subfamily F protein 3
MLTLSGIRKVYGGRTLFVDVALQVNRGDRIGLVGPNGAGKSTLFRLILGEESPDAGSLALHRGMTFGHLPQETAPVADETVLEVALAGWPEVFRLHRLLRRGAGEAHFPPEDLAAWRGRYDELEGQRLEAKARRILAGLSFRERDFDRPASEMSGGWVMRAHLARLLVMEPDLLLLDEPTNHLDLESLLWFQDHLNNYPGGILLISHDRDFLNQLVHGIAELRQARLYWYRGNYDQFLAQRAANEQQQLAAYKHQQREIARLQTFIDRFRAKNTKASQAQSKIKQIERMEKIEAPTGPERIVHFAFPQPQRSGQRVIKLEGIEHAYGNQVVYRNLDFQVERGQRVVLVGPNGAGKSTLLKLLAGVIEPRAGTRTLGHNVRVGYYAQNRVETLHLGHNVLEEAFNTPQPLPEVTIRTVLGSFLFSGDDVFKPVPVLSGGEKSRLSLVKLLLDPPNLLLMDEPTTHLDLASVDSLVGALKQYSGTLVFISHDVYFIRELANHVVQVRDGRLTHYPGNYQYYLDKTAAQAAAVAGLPALAVGTEENAVGRAERERERKRQEAEARQARYRLRRDKAEKVQALEREIHDWEIKEAALTAEMQDPASYQQPGRASELNCEFHEARERLRALMAQWEEAAADLNAFDTSL